MEEKSNKSNNFKVFLKSMAFTAAAILLILIGYFSAGYFSGEL